MGHALARKGETVEKTGDINCSQLKARLATKSITETVLVSKAASGDNMRLVQRTRQRRGPGELERRLRDGA